MAIEIAATSEAALADAVKPSWRDRWSQPGLAERLLFTERLLLLQDTGVALHEGLKEMLAHETAAPMRSILQHLLDQVLEGQPLSQAMAQHPRFFPTTHVALVAAGERGGFLPQVLRQILELDERTERLRSLIRSALSYPAFLSLFSLATIVFVLVGVFPKFSILFEQIYAQLPLSTRMLMALSDSMLQHSLWWLLSVLGLFVAAWLILRQPHTVAVLDRWRVGLPGVRELYLQIYLSQTLRILGMSLAHGVPLVEALKACQDVSGNQVFRDMLVLLRQRVTEGSGLSQSLEQQPLMPPMVRQMIATGERTGHLGPVMTRIADHYERELTKRLALLTRLAEPMMLLVMGAVVGVIVASLILPIFKLSRAVH